MKHFFLTRWLALGDRFTAWRNRPKAVVEHIDDDEIGKDEKLALYLAMASSSLQVGVWYLLTLPAGVAAPDWVLTALQAVAILIAVAAGLSLDFVVVTTTMGRRKGRSSIWSWLTMAAASSFAAAIAFDLYSPGDQFGPVLHMAYPVVVFLFSAHLAQGRRRIIDPLVVTLRADLATAREQLARVEQSLREQLASLREQAANEVRTLREQLAALLVDLATVREQATNTSEEAASLRGQLTDLREQAANGEARAANLHEEVIQLREQATNTSEEAASLREQLTNTEAAHAKATREARERVTSLRGEVDQLQTALANYVPTRANVISYAREQLAGGRSRLDVARALGFPEATLRGMLDKAEVEV